MGGKPFGRGKHLFLYASCIFGILLTLSGCAQFTRGLQKNTPLARAQERMDQGDFASALAENDAALAQPLTSPGDRALFQRGLIYSHPKNPGRDYHRSAEIFQQVVDRFPESDLNRTAQVLISLLHRMSDRERENRSLSEKLDRSRQELNKQKRTGEQYRSELDKRKAQIDQLNRQIEDLKNQIEKIKAIDLNIEKIKQKTDVR